MDTLKKFCINVRRLIAEDQIEVAVHQLRRLLEPIERGLYDEVLVYFWQLRNSRQQYLKGMCDDETYARALTQICNGLFDTVSRVERHELLILSYGRQRTLSAPPPMNVTLELRTTSRRSPKRKFVIHDDVLIGRSDICDIVIPDQFISREHARFIIEGNKVVLEDLGSRNGTFLGEDQLVMNVGVPITGNCTIRLHTIPFSLTLVAQRQPGSGKTG